LFDHKPAMAAHQGKELPASVRMGQRITGMTSGQSAFPVASAQWGFARHGKSGMPLSELLPHTGKIADDICLIKTLNTEAINHDPAITFIQTGSQQPGRPCFGSWLSYGLGSTNENLPSFVVLISQGSGNRTDQPLFSRLWGAGFLPGSYQGVKFRSQGDPVLYLENPAGLTREARREQLDTIGELNQLTSGALHDPETATRIAQYELAYRMQASVPEVMDISKEPKQVLEDYGAVPGDSSFANNCLLARRLVEQGVRFVHLFDWGWDFHGTGAGEDIRGGLTDKMRRTDKPVAALIRDLRQRGLLDDTLIVWGGEFGRTTYSQGALTETNYGRDHHPRCFTVLMAGAGVKKGTTFGATDDFSYNIVEGGVHVHDLNATIMHLMGVEHTRLTYRYQGRDFRLTDIHGEVVKSLLA
jgi:uncharacterized protein (DUF1501 family)